MVIRHSRAQTRLFSLEVREDRDLNFPEWPSVISVSVVPVVIISACGLPSLAFYGRLAALVSRLRLFQREMLWEQQKWAKEGPGDHQQLLEVLRTQTLQVTERARLIRRALFFFLVAVPLLIVCRLTPVTSWVFPAATLFAAVLFVLGLLSMLGGVISALVELRESLEQVKLERRFVFHAVEPSLSDERQDSGEIFTDTSSWQTLRRRGRFRGVRRCNQPVFTRRFQETENCGVGQNRDQRSRQRRVIQVR
jgi:hypothetical protein